MLGSHHCAITAHCGGDELGTGSHFGLEGVLESARQRVGGRNNERVSASNSEVVAVKNTETLSAVDQKIMGFVSGSRVHIDDLISSTGLSSADILGALTTLELKGIIQQHPGKFFSLKK